MPLHMWSSTQTLASYGEAVGTMLVTGALVDWSLNDGDRQRLADCWNRLWGWAAEVRQRWVVGRFDRTRVRQVLVASVFVAEAVLFGYLMYRMGYRGRAATTTTDVLTGELLLFAAPFTVAATALLAAGPRLIARLTGRGNLLACTGRCLLAALAADLAGYGALWLMDATLQAFGPRALIDWWDARLLIYAAEYTISGMIVSAIIIAHLLLAICAAAWVANLLLALTLVEGEVLARLLRRCPKQSLLGTATALVGAAVILKDWM